MIGLTVLRFQEVIVKVVVEFISVYYNSETLNENQIKNLIQVLVTNTFILLE